MCCGARPVTRNCTHCPRWRRYAATAAMTSLLCFWKSSSLATTGGRPRAGTRQARVLPETVRAPVRNRAVVPMSSSRTSSETTADAVGSAFDNDRRRSVSRGCPEGSRYHDSARVMATGSTSADQDSTTRTTLSLSRARTRRTRPSRWSMGRPCAAASWRAASTCPRSTRLATQRAVASRAGAVRCQRIASMLSNATAVSTTRRCVADSRPGVPTAK